MIARIAGAGWVTPLGAGVEPVYARLLAGERAETQILSGPHSQPTYRVMRVPDDATRELPRHSRLRRASAISRFAVGAALGALKEAELDPNECDRRMALVLAVSNGGVVYTKRFFEEIVLQGAQAASPLLFPETVFNAPASHLAAILGITGATYTVVGDGAVGLLALKMAEDLMHQSDLEHCLVVAAEEADWLLCDAFRRWRLLRKEPPLEVFRRPAGGTILSEGAGALLLAQHGDVAIKRIAAGGSFAKRGDAAGLLKQIVAELEPGAPDVIVGSANGTFIDEAERNALRTAPFECVYAPKAALGDSVGASTLWQLIIAREALRSGRLPGTAGLESDEGLRATKMTAELRPGARALVLGCGMSQQAAGALLSVPA